MCACYLTENEHKKRQKVQKEKGKDEIEPIGPKVTVKTENNGKSASLVNISLMKQLGLLRTLP